MIKPSREIILLAVSVMDWWKDAQFWEAYPGRNRFDEEPPFVTKARQILEDAKE